MVKKIIAIFLSVLCLCNIAPVFGAVKSNNKKSVQRKSHKYGYVVASVVGTGVAVPSLWYLIKKIGNNLDVQTIRSWEDVGNLYFAAADKERSSRGETAEYFEHLADGFRCLLNLQGASDEQHEHFYLEASKHFERASELYTQRANGYSNGIQSYGYQINSAKAAEMLAKSEECLVISGIPACGVYLDYSTGMIGHPDRRLVCAEKWEQLKGKKPSYDAYAEAKRLGLLFKCGKSDKEAVYRAWMEAYERDKDCSKNCFIYNALAAEAYQEAQDARGAELT